MLVAEWGGVAADEVAEVFAKGAVGAFDFSEGEVVEFGGDSESDERIEFVFVVAHVCSLIFKVSTFCNQKFSAGGVNTPLRSKKTLDTGLNTGCAGEKKFFEMSAENKKGFAF